jgi:hypothetical protein
MSLQGPYSTGNVFLFPAVKKDTLHADSQINGYVTQWSVRTVADVSSLQGQA